MDQPTRSLKPHPWEGVLSWVKLKIKPKRNKDLGSFVRPLITSFIIGLGYEQAPKVDDEAYWAALNKQAAATGVSFTKGSNSYQCFLTGGVYALACLPNHPLDVKLYVGLYTWIATIIDDQAREFPEDLQSFHQRFARGEPQPTPCLETWAEIMRSTFKYWDPVAANSIVAASLDFTNACALEVRPEYRRLVRTKGGQSFAWHLRYKDGIGDAYAYFLFPKDLYPNLSCFLEAIPDLSIYICLLNDALSFYKEENKGEERNYIHNRAYYESKDVRRVLKDIILQIGDTVRRMRIVVKGREPYESALNDFVLGYIAFHILSGRYMLSEVGLGEVIRRGP